MFSLQAIQINIYNCKLSFPKTRRRQVFENILLKVNEVYFWPTFVQLSLENLHAPLNLFQSNFCIKSRPNILPRKYTLLEQSKKYKLQKYEMKRDVK